MEQFVFVPDSEYKVLNSQSVTKQQLQSIKIHRVPRIKLIHSTHTKEINKKFSQNRFFDRQLLFLSKYQALKLAYFFRRCRPGVLLPDIAQQLHRTNADAPEICFTSFEAAGITPALV